MAYANGADAIQLPVTRESGDRKPATVKPAAVTPSGAMRSSREITTGCSVVGIDHQWVAGLR